VLNCIENFKIPVATHGHLPSIKKNQDSNDRLLCDRLQLVHLWIAFLLSLTHIWAYGPVSALGCRALEVGRARLRNIRPFATPVTLQLLCLTTELKLGVWI